MLATSLSASTQVETVVMNRQNSKGLLFVRLPRSLRETRTAGMKTKLTADIFLFSSEVYFG
jgi:hypothetical protein